MGTPLIKEQGDAMAQDLTLLATPKIIKQHIVAKRIQAEISLKEKELEALKEELKLFMGDHTSLVDKYNVVLATYKKENGNRFDSALFKTKEPKMYQAYLLLPPKRPFILK